MVIPAQTDGEAFVYKKHFVVHRIIEFPELERAHKDHQIQLLALQFNLIGNIALLVTHGQVICYT